MGNFMELRVWQIARDLAVNIYKLTQNQYFKKDFGFRVVAAPGPAAKEGSGLV